MDPSSNRSRERSLSVSRPPPEGSRKEKEDSNDEASSESPKLRLLAARDDRSALPALVRSLTDKSSPEALDACLAELSEEEHSSLWTSLQLFVAEEASKALAGEASEGFYPEVLTSLVLLAQRSANLCHKHPDSAIPEGLKSSSQILHRSLPFIKQELASVKAEICLLCELWYTLKLQEKEAVVENALTFLLQRATSSKATRSDVKRVFALHRALLELPLRDLTTKTLHDLLLKAAQSPAFTKCSEGVRFLVFLFSLSPSFVGDLHEAIKQELPGVGKQVALAYGEIYYKAWRASEDAFNEKIELSCVQDFMERGVLANRALPSAIDVFTPVFHILSCFHNAKNDFHCQATMCKLWEPILWRHLKATNDMVRQSGAELFFSAFPLENPRAPLEEKSGGHERQCQIMLTLLVDESVDVRVSAIHGVVRTLSNFWPILPVTFIKQGMRTLLRDLAFDASTPKTRAAVIQALRVLVSDCPNSHMFLKRALPHVGDCLHDISERVRASFVELLTTVKAVRMIQYWQVCPLDSLLARLAVEQHTSVSKGIAQLLLNSFWPMNDGEQDENRIKRCVYLIKKNRAASRKFYELTVKHLSLPECIKFMLAILVKVRQFVKAEISGVANDSLVNKGDKENGRNEIDQKMRKKSTRKSSRRGCPLKEVTDDRSKNRSNKSSTQSSLHENSTPETGGREEGDSDHMVDLQSDLRNPAVVSGLLDIVCIFWVHRSNDISLRKNAKYRSLLEKKAAKILIDLFKYYKSSEVIGSVVYLCSLLPHSSVSTIAGFCLSRLKSVPLSPGFELTDEDERAFDLTKAKGAPTLINALCNWGRGDDVLELITDWIQKDASKSLSSRGPPEKRRKSSRVVRFAEASEPPSRPSLALALVEYLLLHPVDRAILLKKNVGQLGDLRETLKTYLPAIKQESVGSEMTDRKILLVWDSLLKLTVLIHQVEGDAAAALHETCDRMEECMEWLSAEVLDDDKPMTELGRTLTRALILVCSNMVTVSICHLNFVMRCIKLCQKGLLRDRSTKTLSRVLLAAYEIGEWCVKPSADPDGVSVVIKEELPNLLDNILVALSNRGQEKPRLTTTTDHKVVRNKLQALLEVYRTQLARMDAKSYSMILRALLKAILLELTIPTKKDKTMATEEEVTLSAEALTEPVSTLLAVVSIKRPVLDDFLEEWMETLKTATSLHNSATSLALLETICRDHLTKASKVGLKNIIDLIENNVVNMNQSSVEECDESNDEESVVLVQHCKELLTKVKSTLGFIV